jgi:hypothetical protein
VRATNWITEVNGIPVSDLDSFLAVIAGIGDKTDVRLRCVDLQDRKRIFTLRTDLHYWPTVELRRVYGTGAGAAGAGFGGSGSAGGLDGLGVAGAATAMLKSRLGGTPASSHGVVADASRWTWQLLRHSTSPLIGHAPVSAAGVVGR